jgi:hypothetical protein
LRRDKNFGILHIIIPDIVGLSRAQAIFQEFESKSQDYRQLVKFLSLSYAKRIIDRQKSSFIGH